MIENSRLGFSIKVESLVELLKKEQIEILSSYTFDEKEIFVIADPDGHKIELMKKEKCSK